MSYVKMSTIVVEYALNHQSSEYGRVKYFAWILHIIYIHPVKLTDDTDILKNSTDLQKVESHDLTSNSSNGCKDDQTGLSKFPLEKVCAES